MPFTINAGIANGYASLDAGAQVPLIQLGNVPTSNLPNPYSQNSGSSGAIYFEYAQNTPSTGRWGVENGTSGGTIFTGSATNAVVFGAVTDSPVQFFQNNSLRLELPVGGGVLIHNALQLGVASSATGSLNLANSASAFLTTIQAGNAAAARTYIWPTNFGAAGSVLTDAAGNGTLSWAVGASKSITVTPKATTPITVNTSTDVGSAFTNEGASAQIVFNLPAAAAGLTYTFIVQDVDGIQVVGNGTNTIRLSSAVSSAGGTATSIAIGSVLTLVAINASEWVATSITGTWITA
jgi:hypothetical protein